MMRMVRYMTWALFLSGLLQMAQAQVLPQYGTMHILDRSVFEQYAARSDFPGAMQVREVKLFIANVHTASPTLYFQNTQLFPYHYDFATDALGWTIPLSQFNSETYFSQNRKNLAGSLIAHDQYDPNDGSLGIYTLEFWPTDPVRFAQVKLAYELVTAHMPFAVDKLYFHAPGETQRVIYNQEKALYEQAGLPVIATEDLYANMRYTPLNPGESYGLLKIVDSADSVSVRDIVVLKTLPNTLSHVAGIITETPQTPLSHINVKAKQNITPNAYLKDASTDPNILALVGQYVKFEVLPDGLSLTPASYEDVNAFFEGIRPTETQYPPRNLDVTQIAPLSDVQFKDANAFGAKAVNVAELDRCLPPGMAPQGFAVPFYFYDVFMQHNDFYTAARLMIEDPNFQTTPAHRVEALDRFREQIRKKSVLPSWMMQSLQDLLETFDPNTSLRCRSSTNNEDLPEFNGAGLYDSYTHHPNEGHMAKSMKQVWASLWTYRAFEERDFYRIDHFSTAMGVLVHPNYSDEQVNGVAITKNIYDVEWPGYYVNAQLGEDLVTNPEALSIPEEFLVADLMGEERYEIQYVRFSNAIDPGEHLLTKAQVFQLADMMGLIQNHFRVLYDIPWFDLYFAMDIEFKITTEGKLAIKQARPWID
ncbi:MAG: hypothetical protein GY809_10065 [Planctomycetes bacterium]|nr:hypothetical protein [Planctomycetota bacterium]